MQRNTRLMKMFCEIFLHRLPKLRVPGAQIQKLFSQNKFLTLLASAFLWTLCFKGKLFLTSKAQHCSTNRFSSKFERKISGSRKRRYRNNVVWSPFVCNGFCWYYDWWAVIIIAANEADLKAFLTFGGAKRNFWISGVFEKFGPRLLQLTFLTTN